MKREIKQKVIRIINIYKEQGPQWKPGKDIIHLKKRITRRDVPFEFTLREYNKLIVSIVTSEDSFVYLYHFQHFEQEYFVFSTDSWLVIIGENTLMETAMISRYPNRYLNKEKGYICLGTVEEVLKWNNSN